MKNFNDKEYFEELPAFADIELNKKDKFYGIFTFILIFVVPFIINHFLGM